MPVETFGYINSLNASNPPGSDGLAQGDDHIRGIKSTLLNTFTGITGSTNVTQATLNSLQNETHQRLLPTGMIADFLTGPPAGWIELNGQAVSRTTYAALYAIWGNAFGAGDGSTTFNVADFSDRYRRQRSSTYGVLTTLNWAVGTHNHTASASTSLSIAADGTHSHGGVTGTETVNHTHGFTTSSNGAHSHGGATGSADRSLDHTHSVNVNSTAVTLWSGGGSFSGLVAAQTAAGTTGTASGGSLDHLHTIASDGTHNHTGTTGIESAAHAHAISADGSHGHAGSTATTSVTVNNSTTQENIPNTFVVITCVKA